MQEFSSISVSSYDAAALADRLTQKSAEGWDVIAIVPTGTNVTAFLSRPTDGAGAPADDTSGDTSDTPGDTPSDTPGDTSAPAEEEFSFSLASATTPEAAAAETALADHTPEPEPEPEPVEPAGWGTAPESAPTPEPDPAPAPAVSSPFAPTLGGSTAVAEPTPEPTPEPEPEPEPVSEQAEQQSGAGAAPAGWYADPAGRFELRYWDGNQWTEHVSRAGQQYTDPPVA